MHLDPCTWLTAEERKDHAARIKAAGPSGTRKRKEAFPGDDAAASDDCTLDPFAEWPWKQSLVVHTADSYTMLGRRLRHALTSVTWSNRHFTDRLTILSSDQQERDRQRIFDSFIEAVECQRPERALLLETHAVEEAKSVMESIVSHCAQMAAVYPGSPMLAHIAS